MKDVHQTVNVSGIERKGSLAENDEVSYYASVYGFSLIALFVTGLFKAMVFVKVSLTGSTNLHNRMLHSVLAAVTSFFDTTPTGRILNRFSKDMDEIDVKLPFASEALLQNMITCIGFLGMIVWVFPLFLLASFPLCALFLAFYLCFRSGIRGLKRTENLSRSPLFDHVSSSLDGITTIHSFGQGNRFLDGFKAKLDEHSGAMFMFNAAVRWQAVWLDLLVVAVTFQ
ncbi:multidrug Resistance Protein family member (mrp-5) [Aphelenchoides avenae]|nr:multidrug Resistance Protein family member (mrp-5) [Aphelenchus avenae]